MKLGAAFPEIIYSFFLFCFLSLRKEGIVHHVVHHPSRVTCAAKPPRGSPPVPAQVQPFSSRYMHDHARSRSARGNARDRWNSFLADNTRVWQFRCFIFSSSLFFLSPRPNNMGEKAKTFNFRTAAGIPPASSGVPLGVFASVFVCDAIRVLYNPLPSTRVCRTVV